MRAERLSSGRIRALLADDLPIKGARVAAVVTGGEEGMVPLLEVDCSARPDVAGLARADEGEGERDATLAWYFVLDDRGGGAAVLTVAVDRPIGCDFKLVVNLRARSILGAIVEAGGLALDTGEGVMFVSTPTRDLRAILQNGELASQ